MMPLDRPSKACRFAFLYSACDCPSKTSSHKLPGLSFMMQFIMQAIGAVHHAGNRCQCSQHAQLFQPQVAGSVRIQQQHYLTRGSSLNWLKSSRLSCWAAGSKASVVKNTAARNTAALLDSKASAGLQNSMMLRGCQCCSFHGT